MGVINVTPDSFSDGGEFLHPEIAVARGVALTAEGADLLDVGGESTRPGSEGVAAEMELGRVLPVIRGLRAATDVPISIDTSKAEVAEQAIAAGAGFVNDVTALRADPRMAEVVAAAGVPVCLMHMRGEPATMQQAPEYANVVAEVRDFLVARAEATVAAGVARDRIVIDPGYGFGKRLAHNLSLIRALPVFAATGYPVMMGVSRKSSLGELTGRAVDERLAASIAAGLASVARGARLLRVHDVRETVDALKVWSAIEGAD